LNGGGVFALSSPRSPSVITSLEIAYQTRCVPRDAQSGFRGV
jgi:hypothetical protein